MPIISNERVEEFRRIYQEEFDEEISYEEADEMFFRLVELYKVLLQPLPSELKQQAAPEGQAEGHQTIDDDPSSSS